MVLSPACTPGNAVAAPRYLNSHEEPRHDVFRVATITEVYEHGRWALKKIKSQEWLLFINNGNWPTVCALHSFVCMACFWGKKGR
jgi:hypothetical protein